VQWPCPRRFRPFGYNPVELSRFAMSFPFGNSIAYLARSRRVFADPETRRKRSYPDLTLPMNCSTITLDTPILANFAGFSASTQGFSAPSLAAVVWGTRG
jgi:hypothetical protein